LIAEGETRHICLDSANRPKSLVTNTLVTLSQKGIAKRVAREKAAGYYLLRTDI
jgi:hypothetical protein